MESQTSLPDNCNQTTALVSWLALLATKEKVRSSNLGWAKKWTITYAAIGVPSCQISLKCVFVTVYY